jgi:eukaryotic-like serine/threonine-protein kinase
MSSGGEHPIDPRFANLDANATIELCSSLADYGEAGGLSRDLMMQVGRYAEARYGDDLEVLVAAARMYLLGGEAVRARTVLVRAGRLGLDEERVLPLLANVLTLLGDPRSAEQVLREAPEGSPPDEKAARPPSPRPELPAIGDHRSFTPTIPMTRLPGHGPSRPTTPIVRQGHPTPEPSPASARTTTPLRPLDVRTEVSRRAITGAGALPAVNEGSSARRSADDEPLASPPLSAPPLAVSLPDPATLPRPTRIRVLEPDDERRRLDPYEIIGEIASGGMATVFLGRLVGAGGFSRFVAIKQLHPHLAREEQFVQMFLDEARLAAGIHNPHVVPILEVGMSKAGYFLVMEFIEGDTLAGLTVRELQRGAVLSAPVALRIVLDALTGLHAAHQLTDAEGQHLGLVHRDCTPQNILVGVDGSARLTDFGVARAASRLAITRPQQVKGKVAYLSPEQAHAMDLDRRSDIFTMGIVLWEALAGRSLFQADTEAATLSRLVSGGIPSVRSFVPDLPEAIDEVCRRALHRDRSRRFRTAAEMGEALELAAQADGFAGVASSRELGKFVEASMGAELTAQRDAVRAGLAPNSAARAASSPRPSQPPPSLPAGDGSVALQTTAPSPVAPAVEKTMPAGEAPRLPTAPTAESGRPQRPVRGLVDRVSSFKLGTPRGAALLVIVVILATSPLWLPATKRMLWGHPAPAGVVHDGTAAGP